MPLAWLGVVSCDGRRFDELTTSWLPVNILRREDDGSLYPDAIIVGRIIDVARAADGRVAAVCEFWEPVDPALVLGMDAVGTGEFECVELGPDGVCVDGRLAFTTVELMAATLQSAELFIWPEMLKGS